jgi:D-alanyl-D-alanine carboxypeptidase
MPDGSRWSAAMGEADLGSGRPVTEDTPFVVGSITKTFVAALVLQLAEEGLLELDAPLSRWLPDYPDAGEISLRQLLNHTSGVFNYFEHPRYNSIVFGGPQESWTPEEILSRFRRTGHFPPGQGFRYSNTGYILLGLVIEAVTGNSLGDELRGRIFEPLGMNDTYFQGDGPPPRSAAQGHLRRQRGYREISDGTDYRPTTSAATVAWAAGAIVSSAHDIATWGRALYGGDVLRPASLAEMIDVGATPHARGTYGLGTRTRLLSGARAFGHTGSLRGFMGAVWHLPDEGVTIVVLTNLGRIDANLIADRLASVALGR